MSKYDFRVVPVEWRVPPTVKCKWPICTFQSSCSIQLKIKLEVQKKISNYSRGLCRLQDIFNDTDNEGWMKKNQEHSNKYKCVTVLKLNAGYPAQVHLGERGKESPPSTVNLNYLPSNMKPATAFIINQIHVMMYTYMYITLKAILHFTSKTMTTLLVLVIVLRTNL